MTGLFPFILNSAATLNSAALSNNQRVISRATRAAPITAASLRQACAVGQLTDRGGVRGSAQLFQEQADFHVDAAIYFSVASAGGHEMAAGHALGQHTVEPRSSSTKGTLPGWYRSNGSHPGLTKSGLQYRHLFKNHLSRASNLSARPRRHQNHSWIGWPIPEPERLRGTQTWPIASAYGKLSRCSEGWPRLSPARSGQRALRSTAPAEAAVA